MTFTEKMTEKARSMGKTLVLPEGTESRTLRAARIVTDQKISSKVTLLGETGAVNKAAEDAGVSLDGIAIVDPASSPAWMPMLMSIMN
jgi:phosphate acetyltransferase